jgi:hypothetical protein
MKSAWFFTLLCFICLEGMGRKYIPAVPGVVFYFAKDVVLLYGYVQLRPPAYVSRLWRNLYGGFAFAWIAAFVWTALEMFNPAHDSIILAFIGIRAYWLWWIAPVIIAGILQDPKEKKRAIYLLSGLSVVIALLAMVQFVSPPSADVNLYGYVEGEAVHADSSVVASTGRARVASTFSYISGFSDFTVLVPALLLSLGLGTNDPPVRRAALTGAFAIAAAMPMSGSRGPLVLGLIVLGIISWSAGLFLTNVGRRVLIGVVAGAVIGVVAFPEAFQGVQDRFTSSEEETTGRFMEAFQILPPVSMATVDYPLLGLGTGMHQNARWSFHLPEMPYAAEAENHRYLIELGPVGFSLFWLAKVGLLMLLLKCRRILVAANRRAGGGAALAYAVLTMFGNLTFDHVWQALYFTGVGFVFAEVLAVLKEQQAEREAQAQGGRAETTFAA